MLYMLASGQAHTRQDVARLLGVHSSHHWPLAGPLCRRRAGRLAGDLVMGKTAPQKMWNAARTIQEGLTYPVRVVCRKPT